MSATADIYKQSEPKDKADIIAYLKNIPFVPSETGEFKVATRLHDAYNPDLKFLLGAKHPELFCSQLIAGNASYREFCLARYDRPPQNKRDNRASVARKLHGSNQWDLVRTMA